VARDDDFMHGMLQSTFFAIWWSALSKLLPAPSIIESFPFPWPPAASLGSLTSDQEEQRHAIARAARIGDRKQIDEALGRALDWPFDAAERGIFSRLHELNIVLCKKDETRSKKL